MQKMKEKSNQSWCVWWNVMKVGKHFQKLKLFSISENEWKFAPDLIHPRCDHGIGRIEDHIFHHWWFCER